MANSETTKQAVGRIALRWLNTRDSMMRRAQVVVGVPGLPEPSAREFTEALDMCSSELLTELGIVDKQLLTALTEVLTNAGHLL